KATCACRLTGSQAAPSPAALPSNNWRRRTKREGSLEEVIETALDPLKIFLNKVGGANIHINLCLQHLAAGIQLVLKLDRNFFLRVPIHHHVAQVVGEY